MSRLNRTLLSILMCLWTVPSALWIYAANTSGTLESRNVVTELRLALSHEPDLPASRNLSDDQRTAAIGAYVAAYASIRAARENIKGALLPPLIGYALILGCLLPLSALPRYTPP